MFCCQYQDISLLESGTPGGPEAEADGTGGSAGGLQASPSHRVQGALQCIQRCTPETGALHTHGQWFVFLYICTNSFFLFHISSYTDVELTPCVYFCLPSRTQMPVSAAGLQAPYPFLFHLVHPLLTSDYNILGL